MAVVIISLVLPFPDPEPSMASTIFLPLFTLPKTTRLPSDHSGSAGGNVAQGLAIHSDVEAHSGLDRGWAAQKASGWQQRQGHHYRFSTLRAMMFPVVIYPLLLLACPRLEIAFLAPLILEG